MDILPSPSQNYLLAALPATEFERIVPHLELAAMSLGQVLCESGSQFQYVYFPTTAIVSQHYAMENVASSEIARVGNEGVVGVPLYYGREYYPEPGNRLYRWRWLSPEGAIADG